MLLPDDEEGDFKASEIAEKLKLQLKKLELIRLLSDQMLKRKRLGRDIFFRGVKGSIRSIYGTKYSLTLFEILKTYSSIIMIRDFQKINIPKLPVLTTEEGIKRIREFFGKLTNWKNLTENKIIQWLKSHGAKKIKNGEAVSIDGGKKRHWWAVRNIDEWSAEEDLKILRLHMKGKEESQQTISKDEADLLDLTTIKGEIDAHSKNRGVN
mgnify:CR=1 FL=1